MSNKIKEALQKLDVANENHWTADGLPRLETVKFNAGGVSVTREDLERDFPGFTKSTAAGYWLSYAEPGSGAVTAPETVAPEQGSGEGAVSAVAPAQPEGKTGTPSDVGDGASPVEQAPEQPAPGSTESETEQPEVELGADNSTDEVKALEASFQEIQERLNNLRGQRDSLNAEIDTIAKIEQRIYDAIQKARRVKGDHKPANAIQDYLASQKRIAAEKGALRKELLASGVSLKELGKLVAKSQLDQSMARPTARRGRGSSGM